MTKPHVTAAMIRAGQDAVFGFTHPGKNPTDVAFVYPPVGLIKAILEAALSVGRVAPGEVGVLDGIMDAGLP